MTGMLLALQNIIITTAIGVKILSRERLGDLLLYDGSLFFPSIRRFTDKKSHLGVILNERYYIPSKRQEQVSRTMRATAHSTTFLKPYKGNAKIPIPALL